MKKNLKKVISAVLSLALAASSFVALNASAATFADVADTASYAEAVNALAALGAISGYEDGTFQPNNNITRAEVATMVVAALNMTADAQNSGATTQFTDVNEKAAWAAGYVNVGVAQGYISGMSATEFAPQDNVTYAQILSMLTRILGYGEFAEARGGWPNGYLTAAATAGILSGVSAGANDAVTRAQVAQLIWNAVQAPVLDITTFSTSNTGTEMQKMDGKGGRSFKTPLSDKFDAYVLNVEITGTSKSLETTNGPEVTMKLTNSNDWDPDREKLLGNYVAGVDDGKEVKSEVAVGNTAAEDYLFSSAKVVATYIDDEWALVYFAPTSKVAQKEVDGSLVSEVAPGSLKIKKSKTTSNTTNYKLSDETEVYVNGVLWSGSDKEDELTAANKDEVKALLEASVDNTVLIEDSGKSGYYNKIMIEAAAIAKISQISSRSDSTSVTLTGWKSGDIIPLTGNLTFKILNDELEDGTKNVTVTKNGQVTDLAALAKDDVVAIKFNIEGKINDSSFIDILATTDVVTGKYYSYDSEDEIYTIGEADYEAAPGNEFYKASDFKNGSSYTFKLDPYGRLFDYELEAETVNLGIVERYVTTETSTASEYDYIQVMTLDGQSKTLYIDADFEDDAATILGSIEGNWVEKNSAGNIINVSATKKDGYELYKGIPTSIKNTAKYVPIQNRIIEYSVKASTGRVKSIATTGFDVEMYLGDDNAQEYNSGTNKLGKALASDAVILDATEYMENASSNASITDYRASSLAGLTDGGEYEFILVYKSNAEFKYAIITKAGSVFGADSNFAVAAAEFSTSSQSIVNDEDVYTLSVVENGSDEVTKLNISQTADVFYGDTSVAIASAKEYIGEGAVFYYTIDGDGFVDKISVIYKGAPKYFNTLYEAETDAMGNVIKLPNLDVDAIRDDDWKVGITDVFPSTANDEIQLLLAPVMQTTSNTVSVAPIEVVDSKYYIDTNASEDYSVTSDTKIYAIDMSGDTTGTKRFSLGAFNGIEVKEADENGKAWLTVEDEELGKKYDFSQAVQMALMMVVDGTVTNALVFMQ